jgi:hypothetical protein
MHSARSIFDAYIVVDWSARSLPSPRLPTADAVWVGEALSNERDTPTLRELYFRTRAEAVDYIYATLVTYVGRGLRTFLGFDFPYSYPSGLSEALNLGITRPHWLSIWTILSRLITDESQNQNNRFEVAAYLNSLCGGATPGPFWGCPPNRCSATLLATSPGYPYQLGDAISLGRLRNTERYSPGVQSAWKLLGIGSVGSQSLLGIPVLYRLRFDHLLAKVSQVWPFETGFKEDVTTGDEPFILHAEIWPGIVPEWKSNGVTQGIRDQIQVRSTVLWLYRLDQEGQLGKLFSAPATMPPEEIRKSIEQEGWLLGSGPGGTSFF